MLNVSDVIVFCVPEEIINWFFIYSLNCIILFQADENKGYSRLCGRGGGVAEANWRPSVSATGYVAMPPYKELPSPSKGYVMAGEASQYCRLDQLPHADR